MAEHQWLAEKFEEKRGHLRAVAYRMLGTLNEADDAVQEAWLRLSRSDASTIENLGGWLTTVVSRVCLDMLRSRSPNAGQRPVAPAPRGRRGGKPHLREVCTAPARSATWPGLGPPMRFPVYRLRRDVPTGRVRDRSLAVNAAAYLTQVTWTGRGAHDAGRP